MSTAFLLLIALVLSANAIVYKARRGITTAQAFEEYAQFWNKTYATVAERNARFLNFKMNARKIAAANLKSKLIGSSATFGFTKFSDMSVREFSTKMLGFKPSPTSSFHVKSAFEKREVLQTPQNPIDWQAKGMITAIKDQGQCGSCWAFSTTETVESANLLAGKQVPNGSPQEIVDCDSSDSGCNGGDPQEDLQWIVNQGGQETDSCYPYTATDGQCNQANCQPDPALKISTVTPVSGSETVIYQMLQQAPLSICADAEPWQNYNGGVLTADQCGSDVDHAIQLTGYSPTQGGYWIVRNSWGANWGENGFIWLQFGQDTCAITSEVTAASV